MVGDVAYPEALRAREEARLRERRAAAGTPVDRDAVGFALSGGGVRSATFALGFFQGLARRQLLRHIDYLSSVSGGGFFGAFLGRLHTRSGMRGVDDVEYVLGGEPDHRDQPSGPGTEAPDGTLPAYRSDVLRYLRENGRYLSPTGSGDTLLGAAVLLRNLVSVHVVLGLFLLFLLLALQLPYVLLAAAEILRVPPLRVREPLLVSPYIVPAAISLVFLVWPTGWAYWIVGHQRGVTRREAWLHVAAPVLLAVLAMAGKLLFGLEGRSPANLVAWSLTGVGLLTLLVAVALDRRLIPRLFAGHPGMADPSAEETSRVRQEVSKLHLLAFLFFLALALVTLVDSAGATLYWWLFSEQAPPLSGLLAGGAGILAVLATAQQLISRLVPRSEERPGLPGHVLSWVVTVALLTLYLLVMGTLSHSISHGYAVLTWRPDRPPDIVGARAFFAAGVFLIVVLLAGQLKTFVNRSGHHALYMARLTRAYLGASNPRRHKGPDRSVLHVVPEDDIAFEAYQDMATPDAGAAFRAAPLHLINVTVNETVDGRSRIQRRDRKGVGLAFGPCGMSLGIRHHVLYPERPKEGYESATACCTVYPTEEHDYRVFAYPQQRGPGSCPWEPLSLGTLVAISGAAFSTGAGFRTTLALSMLCGLANLRLGYWWNSGTRPRLRGSNQPTIAGWRKALEKLVPLYSFLFAEILARFRGTVWPDWYLSDGGHFENLAGYELIRRRLPLIVILDAEADPDYTFHGLASLIRKARIDFGADIRFLEHKELAAMELDHVFGTLNQLRRRPGTEPIVDAGGKPSTPSLSLRQFALARVCYGDGDKTPHCLVYVKPTMTGQEPADLAEYLINNPSFPHQPTSDQFFDESQWESYRMLGEHMATRLFEHGRGRRWDFEALMRGRPATPPPDGPATG